MLKEYLKIGCLYQVVLYPSTFWSLKKINRNDDILENKMKNDDVFLILDFEIIKNTNPKYAPAQIKILFANNVYMIQMAPSDMKYTKLMA